ncbi:hypothetical protein C3489_19470 [Streptomyces sp. Ru71]|nr:hypothetical protein C3489_19470 [Streptomyces sp. Ru71]
MAPAWAGKSALLARFVLDPPPGVDIISFFITSRLARQNDAAAFCEVVQRQLYALLGEEEPLSTPATRDEQTLLAMNRAAQWCAERGRRLVLVVDGLDEDRGVTAGPDCHSIAALLPRVPPHGMRVIVAGRPHPPVPGDVPPGHPLRTTQIDHELEPSPHAEAVRWDAERDLLRLREGGGLGWDLVGLTVAAEGGLSARDFAELTETSQRLVERELCAVDGRSFLRRSAHWTPVGPDVWLLAHEEIQQSAAELLTGKELSAHRARLHSWADGYRSARWPDTTPEYLLRGYGQLLREQGDTPRLVALACDARRHERLWQVSGADLEALSEVAVSFDQILADGRRAGDQDVAVALRLAAARDALHDRTANLPAALIGLWSRLGHTGRALGLAKSQRESYDRVAALADVAGSLAATGQADEAAALLDEVDGEEDRCRLAEAIVKGLADSGRHAAALRLARDIDDAERRAQALVAVVEAVARAASRDGAADDDGAAPGTDDSATRGTGDGLAPGADDGAAPGTDDSATLGADAAAAALEAVDATVTGTGVLTESALCAALAASLSLLGDGRQALRLADRACRCEESEGAFRRPQVLALAARRMSAAPALAALAARCAATAAELTAAMADPDDVEWLFPQVAAGLGATGQHERALDLVESFLADPEDGLVEIGVVAAESGDVGRALALAEDLTEPIYRAKVLNAVGKELAASGDPVRTMRVADRALDVVGDVLYPHWQVQLLVDTADFLYRAGHRERADAVLVRATHLARYGLAPWQWVNTLVEVAAALGRSGQRDRARRVVRRAEETIAALPDDSYGRLMNLTKLARVLHHTGRRAEADDLFRLLLDEIRTRLGRAERADALQRVAEAFAGTGNPGGAAELAREIRDLSLTADSPSRRRWDTYAAATAFLAAGEVDEALALKGDLPREVVPEFLSGVVEKLVELGDLDRAALFTEETADTAMGERSLGFLAAGTAAGGDIARGLALLDEIHRPVLRERAMPALAKALVRADAPEQARDLADAITAPEHRGKALAVIARSLGPSPRGRLLLVEALSLGPWSQLIGEIADVVPEQLPLLADLVLGES